MEVHAVLRPHPRGHDARLRAGVPDRVDPVRPARRAAGAGGGAARQGGRGRVRRGAALRRGPGRRGRRVRRVLPAAGRTRGLRAPAEAGRHDPRPARDGAGRGRRRRRPAPWHGGLRAGSAAVTEARTQGYYGRPIVRPPVWKQEVGWYLFTGGLAGASSALGMAARVTGNRALARSTTLTAAAALAVSPALLIKDL